MHPRFLFAAGGTGGHVFPGLAVADALREIVEIDVQFVGTRRGQEGRLVPRHGYPIDLLDVEPMVGGGMSRALRGGLIAARASLSAFALLRRIRPSAVVSVGGYAAGPVALAALALRIPVAVLEPNSSPGLTNRVVLPFARRAYLGWAAASQEQRGAGQGGKMRAFGVPIRNGFHPSLPEPGSVANVLVLGGSQGASALNSALPLAVARARTSIGKGVAVTHQTGASNVPEVVRAYAAAGVDGVTVVPFIEDVAAAIATADVVVARSGASTLAEIAAVGRAMILVPFPFAAGDHQTKNAEVLVRAGGAALLPQTSLTSARMGDELARVLGDSSSLRTMGDAARRVGRPDAAHLIAEDLLSMIGLNDPDRVVVATAKRVGVPEGAAERRAT